MDSQTTKYYQLRAVEVFNKYISVEGGISKYFRTAFRAGSKILDIGAASGRDLNRLLDLGLDAYGVEPSEQMRELAIDASPRLAGRMSDGALPSLGNPFGSKFDGIVCSAVLMHIPKELLFDAAFAIRNNLQISGRLLISVPLSRPNLDENFRDNSGRLFAPYTVEYLQLLFERLGFKLIESWKDDDGSDRPGVKWTTVLFELQNAATFRAIDRIEAVLSRDKKSATYKLALFRALCDIAISNHQIARWLPDGNVSVPIHVIAEKWVYYYWPLIESQQFIPQIQGESEGCAHPIAFRPILTKMIDSYKTVGGLKRFAVDHRSDALTPDHRRLLQQIFRKIQDTIRVGPVKYSGGATDFGKIFGYSTKERSVVFNASIWREMSIMGHWINDAIIMRWATLTSKMSKEEIKPSKVIDLLLTDPLPERDVGDVRGFFAGLNTKECVWTGRTLSSGFDVDHVIPFSLWRNNDLWNLMPVRPDINNEKRDMLPERLLLERRKECLVGYWKLLRRAFRHRFAFESSRILGRPDLPSSNWEDTFFHSVIEAIEITALQRKCKRWSPT